MQLSQRIEAFDRLGRALRSMDSSTKDAWRVQAGSENPWFTPESVDRALHGISLFLDKSTLEAWTAGYSFTRPTRTVASIMAGNIPLVGFHDFLCILISGHTAVIKVSSKDSRLLTNITNLLTEIEPGFKQHIVFANGPLQDFDAVIATGSNNSARYFEHYFGKYPNIIRKNRTSCAVLTGHETAEELVALGRDVFTYFGLGCRNVSKIFVPVGFDFTVLLDAWNTFESVAHHHKYHNNYDYQKAILLVNGERHFDNGFVLLNESSKLVSPIAVIYYEYYSSDAALSQSLALLEGKLQCIAGSRRFCTVPFGKTQEPTVTDYADNVDTLKFLSQLD